MIDHVGALRSESATLTRHARALEAPVPTCPGWTVADLVFHVGAVHAFWTDSLRGAMSRIRDWAWPARPVDAEMLAWFESRAQALVDALTTADPAGEYRTFWGPRNRAFLARRVALETAMHRYDAETATGAPGSFEPELAADGVDEWLTVFASTPPAGPVHLHCTDTEGEWLVRAGEGAGPVVTREHAKGDAAVRGDASDLFLLAWRRSGLLDGGVEVLGDAAMVAAWLGGIRII